MGKKQYARTSKDTNLLPVIKNVYHNLKVGTPLVRPFREIGEVEYDVLLFVTKGSKKNGKMIMFDFLIF
jgi:hypothetical protein